ncbi:MAG: hypothetical protein WC310_03670 [Patescibacteria group bacterium]|jgi:hypothetical protein
MLSLRTRRFIAIIFVAVFLIVAPILIFYTAGYRYNFKKNDIQKVGSISVQPSPTTAKIYLNNELRTESRSDNTLRIMNLLPGKYKIAISADGYYSWEKEIEVFSSVNTFINKVVLFKKEKAVNIFEEPTSQLLPSPDNKKFAYITDNNLFAFNINNLQNTPLEEKTKILQLSSWSISSTQFIAQDVEKNFIIYNFDNPDKKLLPGGIINKKIDHLKWSDQVDYLLYASSGNNLYQINTLTKESRLLYTKKPDIENYYGKDFLYLNNEIYYAHRSEQGNWLEKISLDQGISQTNPTKLLKLDSMADFDFRQNQNGTISLIDREKQKFYLINNNFNQILLFGEAKNFSWSTNQKTLLYNNDFEIWIYDYEKNTNQLVDRYGQIINQTSFIPNTDYIITTTDNAVKIIELDARDKRNSIDIANGEKIKNFLVTPKGNKIFYNGKLDSKEGIFEITIQE